MKHFLSPTARVLGGAALAALMTGCMATAPRVEVIEPSQARPVAVVPQGPSSGSLFMNAGYRPLYETPRARQVGDIVTINIVEKVTAKQESTSSLDKTGTVSGGITAVPFLSASTLNKLNVAGTSNNSFDGKGSTESNNTFSGNITATVIEVLPNGHLVVSGEKQIGVNHNVDVLRFSGQIDPITIQPGNVVSSASVANVRVEQRGRGAQAESQGIGWLARFFLSLSPI